MKTALIALILATAILMATAAYAQAATTPPACGNGIQDGTETGVDCGGSCALTVGCVGDCDSSYVDDYCDGKDNDKDCLVDENCKQDKGRTPGTGVALIKNNQPPSQQAAQLSCNDGIQNQDELGKDCGGVCATIAKEVCDGIDNDKDCYVDEGGVCDAEKNTISGQEQQEREEVGWQSGKNITGDNFIKGVDVTAAGSAVDADGGSSADSVMQESSGMSALGNAGEAESPAGNDKQNKLGKPGSSKELAIPIEETAEDALVSAGNADSAQPNSNAAASKNEKEVKTASEAVEGGFFKKIFAKVFQTFWR